MGQSASWGGLQTIQSRTEWLIRQKGIGRLEKRTDLTKFRKKGSAKSSMWGGIAPYTSTNWGQMAGKQLWRGGPGCPCGEAEHEPAMWQKKQMRCISQSVHSRLREVIIPCQLSSDESTPEELSPVLGSDMDTLEQVQEMAGKMIKELECLSCKQRLRGLGLLSFETCQGDFIKMYVSEGDMEDISRLFLVVPNDRTKGDGHKSIYRKLRLNRRKHFFYCKCCQTVEYITQRGCGACILRDTKSSAPQSWATCSHDPT